MTFNYQNCTNFISILLPRTWTLSSKKCVFLHDPKDRIAPRWFVLTKLVLTFFTTTIKIEYSYKLQLVLLSTTVCIEMSWHLGINGISTHRFPCRQELKHLHKLHLFNDDTFWHVTTFRAKRYVDTQNPLSTRALISYRMANNIKFQRHEQLVSEIDDHVYYVGLLGKLELLNSAFTYWWNRKMLLRKCYIMYLSLWQKKCFYPCSCNRLM